MAQKNRKILGFIHFSAYDISMREEDEENSSEEENEKKFVKRLMKMSLKFKCLE